MAKRPAISKLGNSPNLPGGLLVAEHPELGFMFAAIDPLARFVEGALRPTRLGASLQPFRDEVSARAAIAAAGAKATEPADG